MNFDPIFLQTSTVKSNPGNTPAGHQVSAGDSPLVPHRDSANKRVSARLAGRAKAGAERSLGRYSMLLAIPLTIGLAVSGYLAFVAATSSPVFGCAGDGVWDCGHVMNSRWSKWFGVPVSFLAVGTYGLAVLSLWAAHSGGSDARYRQASWMLVTLAGLSVGLAAIWFSSIQVFVLDHLCAYCLTTHASGLAVAGLLVWRRPLGNTATLRLVFIAAMGLCLLILGQVFGKAPDSFRIEYHVAPPANEIDATDNTLFQPPVDSEPSANLDTNTPTARHKHSSQRGIAIRSSAFENLNFLTQTSLMHLSHPTPGAAGLLLAIPQDDRSNKSSNSGEVSELVNQSSKQDSSASTATEGVASQRLISLSGGNIKLDIRQWPLAGQPQAKYVLVELYDYTCSHCRNTHRAIKEVANRFGNDFALLALPVPLNAKCNHVVMTTAPVHAEACELATLSVAVWLADRQKFAQFHDWMFQGNATPTYSAARAYAAQLVGEAEITAELAKKTASEYVRRHVELYRQVGAGNVPKLFLPRSTIIGEFTSGSSLAEKLRQEFN